MKTIILSVTNDIYTDQRVLKMAKSLHNMGYSVVLAGRKSKQELPDYGFVKIHRFSLWFKRSVLFYAEFNIRLFLFLLFARSDVFTSNDLDTLPANFLAAFLRRKPLVYDSHEYFTQSPEIMHKPFVRRVWTVLEKICIKGIDLGITVSDSIAQEYKKVYRKQFLVVRNVPLKMDSECAVRLPDFMNHTNIVIYQGAINLGRGLELAIESMIYNPEMILVIIGSGDIEKQLRVLIEKNNLSQRVFLAGRLRPEILAAYTPKARIGISIEEDLGKNYRFALPNKLFDYIHAGVPVIVSDLPEMRNIVETYKVGAILKERTPEKLTELIKSMIENEVYYSNLTSACKEAAYKLHWENEFLRLERAYKKICPI